MKKKQQLVAVLISLLSMSALLHAQAASPSYPSQKEDDFTIKNFKFQSGETLPELKLHLHHGRHTAQEAAQGEIDNAVLLLHGTTGTGKNFLSPSLGSQTLWPRPAPGRHQILSDYAGWNRPWPDPASPRTACTLSFPITAMLT